MLTTRAFISCYWRSFFIGTGFSTRGLQIIGFMYAMEPGLALLYPDEEQRRQARQRYLPMFNTHPFWAPLLVGVFLSLEQRVLSGTIPPELFAKLKDTTVYTLSAIGDSLFGGTLLVAWSLTACGLAMTDHLVLAIILTVALFVALQCFRLITFILGYREGFGVLKRVKALNLIDLGDYIKIYNGIALAFIMYYAWPNAGMSLWYLWSVAFIGLMAFIIQRFPLSRFYCVLVAIFALCAIPWLSTWLPCLQNAF